MIALDQCTAVEREELRRALVTYKFQLQADMRKARGVVSRSDPQWRLHVVEQLLRTVSP